MLQEQLLLPLRPVRNRALFSSHWLENRLAMEPEWTELRGEANDVLERMAALWRQVRSRVLQYGNEQGLEQGFIQPVLDILGWKIFYQPFLDGRRPDYALFTDDASLDAALGVGRRVPEFWGFPKLVADAKAWHMSLDRPAIVNNEREYPPQQIKWYLDHSWLDFGLLTNGRIWRLIPRTYGPHQRRFQTYLECDLPAILDAWITNPNLTEQSALLDEFLTFYLFFSPVGFVEIDGRRPLVKRAVEGSSEYRIGVGEGLKDQAFEALRLCIEGFLKFPQNNLAPEEDMDRCREQSFILLYRLLFIMYAEDRQLLPYRINTTYTENRSLGRHRDEIATRLDRARLNPIEDYSEDSTDIWEDLQTLFDLVDRGRRTYGVPAYNGGLFDQDAHTFLAQNRLSDRYMARVIDQLGRASDPQHPAFGLFRVDYHDLAIQHLGSIYEGLLELNPHYASERMVVIRRRTDKREERVIQASERLPQGFEITEVSYEPSTVYLLTNKGERRATGSYYTPDHIVDYIVENTLGPICNSISEKLDEEVDGTKRLIARASVSERAELEEKLESLQGDYDDRILRLRVLDPATGSGHFLIRACQFLAEEIATHPFTREDIAGELPLEESALTFWKRRVVENCLYGVDMNPMAVELAKLALWLETVAADRPLTFLDHHIRYGNSLMGAKISQVGVLPGEVALIAGDFTRQVEDQIHVLLPRLTAISEAPSESADQVKEKQRLYREFHRARKAFLQICDLWCSFVTDKRSRLTSELYQSALDDVTRPNRFRRLTQQPWFESAIDFARQHDVACFHWELEFPEVFFNEEGRRPNSGFDAIIGNPPYDVLSEAETGKDLSALKAFIQQETIYEPSRVGKNNLYKLFICRSLDLLAEKGYLGFITPMAVLGDEQASGIRRKIVEVGSFIAIEAFPQKDNPSERVFHEAKLSTTIITILKDRSEDIEHLEFVSRVHPGREIMLDSPSLVLSTATIPLYDPENFTIVSCSQADWDLATRIMQSGRMSRLGRFCTSFQGEVNETIEKGRGSISREPNDGPLILRGSNICLYTVREASQGESLYLKREEFFQGKSPKSKAFHSRQERVGFQRSSPQNNFRRIVAAPITEGNYCFDTVSYIPRSESRLPLPFLLGLLNSKLADWYFRLGSTNSKVNEYQFNNLPCPVFAKAGTSSDRQFFNRARSLVRDGDLDEFLSLIGPRVITPPFSPVIADIIGEIVSVITEVEVRRGEIPRAARSSLADGAQRYQDLIDELFYAMAGLTREEAEGLEARLTEML